MTENSLAQLPQDLVRPNANDLLKARWRVFVARSMVAAAAMHAALFVGLPTWDRFASESYSLEEYLQLEWVSVVQTRTVPEEVSDPGVRVGSIPDSLQLEDAEGFASRGDGPGGTLTLDQVFRERLLGRSAPMPTLTEQVTALEETASNGSGPSEGTIEVGRSVSEVDFSDVLGASPLDLDRLSVVRPELVTVGPSAWVLIRNPAEVERFIVGSYMRGTLDRRANGSVGVALFIDSRGRVEWAEVSSSSGRSDMDQVALEVFSEVASFRPARDEGVAVSRSVIFLLSFPWY